MSNVDDLIIVRVDGGICSQIAFVAFGLALQRTFENKARVKFDLSWFDEWGFDKDRKFPRNWDFAKCFPDISLSIATIDECRQLKKKHYCDGSRQRIFKAPQYIGGYPERMPAIIEQLELLKMHFKPHLTDLAAGYLNEMMNSKSSCSVHVRRGDLKNYDPAYGWPTSMEYFSKAISIVKTLRGANDFFLFSDEPDWVESELLPTLPKGNNYRVITGNGSDKGYLDVYLMAHCNTIISSQGSLGKYAALLNLTQQAPLLIMSSFVSDICGYLPETIYINDDRRFLSSRNDPEEALSFCGKRTFRKKIMYKIWKHLGKKLKQDSGKR